MIIGLRGYRDGGGDPYYHTNGTRSWCALDSDGVLWYIDAETGLRMSRCSNQGTNDWCDGCDVPSERWPSCLLPEYQMDEGL